MFNQKRILAISLLPILLSGCAKAEGALAPVSSEISQEGFESADQPIDKQLLPLVDPASLEPIINYVDGLNLALTGEFTYLRSTALTSCGCLVIAKRLENLFKSATLIGGHYQLTSIKVEKDGVSQKSFRVVIDRSDIRKLDKHSRQSILWSASTISNLFIVQKKGEVWLLSDTK